MNRIIAVLGLSLSVATAAQARLPQEPIRLAESVVVRSETLSGSAPAPEQDTWPSAADVRLGKYCVEAQGWLPGSEEQRRPAALWDCWGGDNQRLLLRAGVLYLGEKEETHLTPATADLWPRCDNFALPERKRRYAVEVCTDRSKAVEPTAAFEETEQGETLMRVTIPRAASKPVQGAPLLVVARNWRTAEPARWVYDEERRHLRIAGSSLCLTAPPAGAEAGAPLYLDDCALPPERNRVELLARAR